MSKDDVIELCEMCKYWLKKQMLKTLVVIKKWCNVLQIH